MEENSNKSNNKGMMMIVLIILVVLLAVIIAGGFFLWSAIQNTSASDENEFGAPVAIGPVVITQEDIRIFEVDGGIVTNLLQEGNSQNRMIRLDVGIGIDNRSEDLGSELFYLLNDRNIVIHDLITDILRRTTYFEISQVDGIGNLREDILIALQNTFASPLIIAVYLSVSTH